MNQINQFSSPFYLPDSKEYQFNHILLFYLIGAKEYYTNSQLEPTRLCKGKLQGVKTKELTVRNDKIMKKHSATNTRISLSQLKVT